MAFQNCPVTVSQGDVFSLYFPLLSPDGTPTIYTAPVGYFSLALTPYPIEGATPALSKDSVLVGGVRIFQTTINLVSTWVAYVDFVAADTEGQTPGGHYYELMVVDGSNEAFVATGQVVIAATITRP
jgi:hypothetical protein